jgi:hypothetical protein
MLVCYQSHFMALNGTFHLDLTTMPNSLLTRKISLVIGVLLITFFLASLVNLDHPGHYIHWHFVNISVGNLIVIVLMITTFIAALLLPFPGNKRNRSEK